MESIFENQPDVALRFQFIIDRYFGSPKEFCSRTGINRGTLSLFLNSKKMRVADTIVKQISAACPDIPEDWIQTGIDQRRVDEMTKDAKIKDLETKLAAAQKTIKRLEGMIDIILDKRKLE